MDYISATWLTPTLKIYFLYLGKEYAYDPSSLLTKSTPSSSELEHVSQVQSLDHSSLSLPAAAFADFSFFEAAVVTGGFTSQLFTSEFCISSFRDLRML